MRRLLTALSVSMISAAALAGPAPLQWNANFNPATGGEEAVAGAITTPSGETHVLYVLADRALKIAKFDNTGAFLGTVNLEENGKDLRWDLGLAVDASGNYVVGGRGHTSNQTNDLGAAKWTPTGSLLWATLNPTGGGNDESGFTGGVGLDAAGNVYVIGESNSGGKSDTVVDKFNSSGVFQWRTSTDAGNDNTVYAFTVLPAGGVTYVANFQGLGGSRIRSVSAANTEDFFTAVSGGSNYNAIAWSGTGYVAAYRSGSQVRVDALDASGSFGGTSNMSAIVGGAYPTTITVRPSGDVFVGGTVGLPAGTVPLVCAFGPTQNAFPVRWSRTYDAGAAEGNSNSALVMAFDSGGTIYVVNGAPAAGASAVGGCSSGGDLVVRRITPSTGVPLFRTVWDGPLNAAAMHLATDSTGDFYLVTESPARVIKYNATGVLQWSRSFTSSTYYCVSSMNRVIVDATEVYVLMDARISATVCCLTDDEDLLVARYNRTTGALNGTWTWTPGGDLNLGPVRFNNAGTNLYLGYGDGSGGSGKIAGVVAFTKATGVVQWSRTFAPTVIDSVTGLSVDGSDNIYASFPFQMPDSSLVTWIRKLDSAGNEFWTRTITTGTGMPLVLGMGTAAVPTVSGIYLAGGEADNFPPSQTMFRGFVQRIDVAGNVLWTRTYDGGQQLAYFFVDVNPSGVPIFTGFTGPAFAFGDGINAGGNGNIVVHAWEKDGLGCQVPLWGALYDSGYGDENPQAVVTGTGFSAVGISTGSGPMILKYGDGTSDAPVLDTRITVSPNPAAYSPTAEVVTIVVTTTNTGGRDARLVAPLLTAVSGSTTFTAILGPTPAGAVTLVGGAARSWTWSATVAGAGTAFFSLTVSGYDTCGSALVTGTRYVSAVTGHRADMVGDMWRTGSVFGIGDLMGLTLTVTNNGIATAMVNSVSVTIYQIGGPVLTPTGDVVRGTGPLAAGASGIMTWTFTATSAGAIDLLEQAGWVDALFGFAKPGNSGGDSVTVYSQARLQGALSVSPSPSTVGQPFTVRLTVTNVGAYTANGVLPALDINTGSGILTAKAAPVPATSVNIAAGGAQTFVWTFTSTGAGIIAFTATAQGTDTSPLGYVARASQSWGGLVQTPAALTLGAVLSSTYIRDGDLVSILMSVTNTGQADVVGLSPGGWHFPLPNGEVTGSPQPNPPLAVAGGATTSFVMSFQFHRPNASSATVWLTATVTGIESNSGQLRTALASVTVYIRAAAAFSAAVQVAPGDVAGGQVATITMTVTNSGSGNAFSVTPMLLRSSTSYADLTSGPTPANVAVMAPGASQVFTWELTGRSFGTVALSLSVSGSQSDSAPLFLSRTATLNVTSSLNSSLAASTADLKEGGTFTLTLNVTNGGNVPILSVSPLLLPVNPALLEIVSGPVPTSDGVMLTAEATAFAWTLKAKGAGTVTLTATATGINSDTSAIDSTKAQATLTIKPAVTVPEFEGDAIVFPNPVTGDAMQVAVKLDGGITDIVMEVYNTGNQRVYHGEWTGLTGAATLLDLKGMKAWGPGAYFIKMVGKGGGSTKVFETVRMRIKRTGVAAP